MLPGLLLEAVRNSFIWRATTFAWLNKSGDEASGSDPLEQRCQQRTGRKIPENRCKGASKMSWGFANGSSLLPPGGCLVHSGLLPRLFHETAWLMQAVAICASLRLPAVGLAKQASASAGYS
jgi:hypothetical protein